MDENTADDPTASADMSNGSHGERGLDDGDQADRPDHDRDDDKARRSAGDQPWQAWREMLFGPEMSDRFGSARDRFAADAPSVLRGVAAKAAELTAMAARSAGPLVHRLAEVTDVAGAKVAVASDHLAADLRAHAEDGAGADAGAPPDAAGERAEPEEPERPDA